MKVFVRILLIVILSGLILVVGLYFFITYQTRSTEKIIYEKFHANGNIALRKVEVYDCCEGSSIETRIYDTLGRNIETYGNQDGSRIKKIKQYQGSNLVFNGYYAIYNDSINNENNFDVTKSRISYLSEQEYYANKQLKSEKTLSYHDEPKNRDTTSLSIIRYDENGEVKIHTEFRKDRDYLRGEKTSAIQWTIIEDKVRGTVDTLKKERIRVE